MTSDRSRRDFLKLSTAGMAGAAVLKPSPMFANGSPEKVNSPIEVWITNDKLKCTKVNPIAWKKASGESSTTTIVLKTEKKLQTILGFGGAFTDAACYTMNRLDPSARTELFHEMFHPSALGLNVCRTCIGASDYSAEVFSYDEGEPDPDLKRFSIEHDRKYVLPILREAIKQNPDLYLFSSPWSPPGWMKANGSMLGGSMRRRYIGNYAQYFIKFLQAYGAEGVPIAAVTPQNEVDTDRMAECQRASGRRSTKLSLSVLLVRCLSKTSWKLKSGYLTITTIFGDGQSANSKTTPFVNIATTLLGMDMSVTRK